MKTKMNKAAREWLWSRDVITVFLKDVAVGRNDEHREELAACLIARLAGHSPPLLISAVKEKK